MSHDDSRFVGAGRCRRVGLYPGHLKFSGHRDCDPRLSDQPGLKRVKPSRNRGLAIVTRGYAKWLAASLLRILNRLARGVFQARATTCPG